MRKFLRYANYLTLLCGGLGMLLMVWLRSNGPDERGLYPAQHPAWTLLLILTLLIPVGLWLLSRHAGSNTSYDNNFPASWLAAVGYLLGGSGMIVTGFVMLDEAELLNIITACMGILSGIALFYGAFIRFTGRKGPISVHCLPCLFFGLQLFCMGQTLGAEPEMCRYLFPFLAVLSAIPACYWLWSFEVDLGKRGNCLFWCLAAGYCNLVATIGSQMWLLHLCVALWLLTALPRLQYLSKRQRPAPSTAPTAEDGLAAPMPVENVVAEVASHTPPVADVDAILEQILKEFGSDSTP